MKWNMTDVKLQDINAIYKQAEIMAKSANPLVLQLRAIFTLENNPITYIYPLVDFIDFMHDNPESKFISFKLGQMVK